MLGVSGLQGSGKSTWADTLAQTLEARHDYKVVTLSLDDLYHNHDNLVKIRESDPSNQLQRTRGQPGTHDEELARRFFTSLNDDGNHEARVPSFDKSKFDGEGDRAPEIQWRPMKLPLDVLIFEGWCMGFSAIPEHDLEARWTAARQHPELDDPEGFSVHTLSRHSLEHLKRVNDNLRRYNETFMTPRSLDYLIHLDTEELSNVYRWRLDQEHALWKQRGSGMSDQAVVKFVQGYMPAYELYLDALQHHSFVEPRKGREDEKTQLRVLLGPGRDIRSMSEL